MGVPVDFDVAVVGGGPIGLATAIEATKAGMRVIVCESRAGTVDKACGEGLMPGAVDGLRRLGVDPHGHDLFGIRYLDSGRVVEHRFGTGRGRGVRRTVLHEALLRRCDELGVHRAYGPVREVRQDALGVVADGLKVSWLMACDGLSSPVRRSLGLDRAVRGRRRYGLRRHHQVAPWSDLVEVHWTSTMEVYVTPVDAHLVGVAVLGPRGLSIDAALGVLPDLRGRLAGTEAVSRQRGAGPLRRRAARVVEGRVLLVGDASGYVDALTGEGVRVGLAQARVAVAAIAADRPGEYAAEWRRVTRSYRWLTSGLVGVSGVPALRRGLVPAAARFPRVFGAAVEHLAR